MIPVGHIYARHRVFVFKKLINNTSSTSISGVYAFHLDPVRSANLYECGGLRVGVPSDGYDGRPASNHEPVVVGSGTAHVGVVGHRAHLNAEDPSPAAGESTNKRVLPHRAATRFRSLEPVATTQGHEGSVQQKTSSEPSRTTGVRWVFALEHSRTNPALMNITTAA